MRDARADFSVKAVASGANWSEIDFTGAAQMSKGMDQKKNTKKKPAKSLMEKRAAKAEKRTQKKWARS